MNRKFKPDGVKRWIVFGTIFAVLYIVFLFSKGSSTIFGLWITYDFCTTCALAAFYFFEKFKDGKKQELLVKAKDFREFEERKKYEMERQKTLEEANKGSLLDVG